MMKDRVTSEAGAQFARDGVIIIRRFFTADEARQLCERLHRYVDHVVPNIPAKYVFYQDKKRSQAADALLRLEQMHLHEEYYEQMRQDLLPVAEALLGEPVEPMQVEMFNKAARIGEVTPPHQDGNYFMLEPNIAITLWIPLERADAANGCMRYVRGSHLLGMRRHELGDVFGFSRSIADYGREDEADELVGVVDLGDLAAHHGMTIHRTDANTSDRTRRAMGLVYYAQRAKVDVEKRRAHDAEVHKYWQEAGQM